MSQINTAARHRVTVKSAQFGESKNGAPCLELGFENAQGETLTGWFYLSEAAFPHTVRALRDAFNFNNNFETLLAQVTEKECEIVTKFETFDGKERLKVQFLNRVGGGATSAPLKNADSALKNFSQMAARLPVETAPRATSTVTKAASTATPAEEPAFPNV